MILLLSAGPGGDNNTVVNSTDNEPEGSIDSFMPIYFNIISTHCDVPACHDGNFEPNFSTLQSAYYTTVYHSVIKNTFDGEFDFRIQPYDTSRSLLIERLTNCCFSDVNDEMPLLGQKLQQTQVDSIATWILSGAPDWRGKFPWKK